MATQQLSEVALEQHADALISLPNVVAVGIVAAENPVDADDTAVAVYVSEMRPASELMPDERIPAFLEAGDQSVPVRVIAIGELEPESGTV